MKLKIIFTFLLLGLISYVFIPSQKVEKNELKKIHATHLKNSPFKETLTLSKKERKAIAVPPNKYLEREWELNMDPLLGYPTPEKLAYIQKQLNEEALLNETTRSVPGDVNNFWVERGPNNIGGRTKALLFDPNDATNETVFAGGVSGGLWKNTNISNPGSQWQLIDVTENLAVSSIVADPNNSNTFYLGTGESYTNGDSYGNGVWKSTDAGATWSQIFGGIEGDSQYQSNALLTVNSPAAIAGDYPGIQAGFGLELTSFTGNLVLAEDATTPFDDICSAITNAAAINGNIAVIKRGDCNFTDKVEFAVAAGATGVIMINNVSGTPISMGTADGYDDSVITISSIMISDVDGETLLNAMASETVNITVNAQESLGAGLYLVPGKTHINDLLVKDNAGSTELYVAVADSYYSAASTATVIGSDNVGLYKTLDNGTSFSQVTLPTTTEGDPYTPMDLEIGFDGTIWLSTTNSLLTGTGGGSILSSPDGSTFTLKHEETNGRRVEIATSKTDPNKVYAVIMVSNVLGTTQIAPYVKILKTTDSFSNVNYLSLPNDSYGGIPSDDFTNGQGWYDLALEVNPTSDETIYIGGINWFKSSNGGSSWSHFSYSYGGGSPNLHPDQHNIVFANSNTFLIGNDGGVAYSNNGGVTIVHQNNNFNVTQFYHMAVAPTTSFTGDYFVAGAQDNGSLLFENAPAGISSAVLAQGGDGAYCFFDQDGTDRYFISNYVYNDNIKLYNYDTDTQFTINSESGSNGDFINVESLDSNNNVLFSNYSSDDNKIIRAYKILSLTGSGFVTASSLTHDLLDSSPTALKVSPFNTANSTLYAGLENGNILKISNANNSPTWELLTDEIVGSISDIEFGQTENDIFVTVHNYGVNNIWFSNDGGTSWQEKEGDLPDLPVKCILQNPLNLEQVLIGTELGTWWTQNFSDVAPNWYRGTNGMNSVKVTDLQLRDDNMVFASTYGRGVFSGQFTADDGTVGFDDLDQNTSIGLFPNPSEGKVSFKLPNNLTNPKVRIYDITGRLVFDKEIDSAQNDTYSMNLDNLESGNYIVHVKTQNVSYSSKLIIK